MSTTITEARPLPIGTLLQQEHRVYRVTGNTFLTTEANKWGDPGLLKYSSTSLYQVTTLARNSNGVTNYLSDSLDHILAIRPAEIIWQPERPSEDE